MLGDLLQHVVEAAAELGRIDAALPQGQVRPRAGPLRARVGARRGHQEGPQRRQGLQIGKEAQRPFHAEGRHLAPGGGQRPYSRILRVRVLRWMPRMVAAAPIWPPVCASTRVM